MGDEERAVTLAFYAAARAEIVQRIALREQVLLASVTANGIVAGIAYKGGSTANLDLLLLIPWISLVFTIAWTRHTIIMQQLGSYINVCLRKSWDNAGFTDYDGWPGKGTDPGRVFRRYFYSIEILVFSAVACGPPIAALLSAFPKNTGFSPWYFAGTLATVATAAFFIAIFTYLVKRALSRTLGRLRTSRIFAKFR